MHILHDMLMDYPGVSSGMAYKIPFYYRRKAICYLNPVKPDGVEMVFTHGRELTDPRGILQDKGRKLVAGITLHTIEDIDPDAIKEIIAEAILLDRENKTHFSKKMTQKK